MTEVRKENALNRSSFFFLFWFLFNFAFIYFIIPRFMKLYDPFDVFSVPFGYLVPRILSPIENHFSVFLPVPSIRWSHRNDEFFKTAQWNKTKYNKSKLQIQAKPLNAILKQRTIFYCNGDNKNNNEKNICVTRYVMKCTEWYGHTNKEFPFRCVY